MDTTTGEDHGTAGVMEDAVNTSNEEQQDVDHEPQQAPNLIMTNREEEGITGVMENAVNTSKREQQEALDNEFVDKVAKEQSQIDTLQQLKNSLVGGIETIAGQLSEAQSSLAKTKKEVDEVAEAKNNLLADLGSIMSSIDIEPSDRSTVNECTNEETEETILITELSSWSISNNDDNDESDEDNDTSIIPSTDVDNNCIEEEGLVFRNNQLKIGIEYFNGIELKEVDSLPSGINGKSIYKMKWIHYNDDDRRSDGRNWEKAYNTTPYNFNSMCDPQCKGDNRRRKIQKCIGEYRCTNENCTYLHYFKTPNISQYKRQDKIALKQFFCKTCGEEMSTVKCEDKNLPEGQPPRRYISICQTCKMVGLYYIGIHSCQAKTKLAVVDKKFLEDSFRANPRLTPLQAQRNLVIQAVHVSEDVNATYDSFSDLQAITRVRRRVKRDEISDAIHLIAKIDQSLKDKYLIRQVQNTLYLTSDYKLSRLEEIIKKGQEDQTRVPCAISIDGNFSLIRGHCILALTIFDMCIARVISVGEIVIKLEDGKGGETGTAVITNS
jgi:hypothetical protein